MARSSIQPEPHHAHVPKIFRGIPTIPKFPAPGPVKQALRDYNYIKAMNHIPCAPAGPQIIIETGLQTAGPALLSLFLPGCTDIIKTKLGLSPWHARGIKGMIKKASPPQALGATKFLYQLGYFTAEKYLWFFQVAEVTKEFFITWQSQVFMAQQCQLPGAGTAYGYMSPFIYPQGTSGGLGITAQHNAPGVAIFGNGVALLPGFQGTMAWSAEWDSWPVRGQGTSVTTWMTEEDTEVPFDVSTTNDPNSQQGNTTGGSFYWQNRTLSATRKSQLFYINNGDTAAQVVGGTWSFATQGRSSGLKHFGCYAQPVEWPFPKPAIPYITLDP